MDNNRLSLEYKPYGPNGSATVTAKLAPRQLPSTK